MHVRRHDVQLQSIFGYDVMRSDVASSVSIVPYAVIGKFPCVDESRDDDDGSV